MLTFDGAVFKLPAIGLILCHVHFYYAYYFVLQLPVMTHHLRGIDYFQVEESDEVLMTHQEVRRQI